MTELLHIIDAQTPDEAMLSCAALRGSNDPLVCLGLPPETVGRAACCTRDKNVAGKQVARPTENMAPTTIIRPSAMKFGGGARRLADVLSHGQPICVWSCSALESAISASAITASPIILFLPTLPDGEMLEKLPWRLAEHGITLAVETQNDVDDMLARKANPKRLALLQAPVITPAISDNHRRTVRKELDVPDDTLLLVAPSQMRHGSGHDWACWAHAILRHAGVPMKLLFPRSGPNEPHVRFFSTTTGFEDEIIFADGRYRDDQVLSAADIALFFHDRDFGQARILQAMAGGCCVLASKTPGIMDILTDGTSGLLSPAKKPRGFSASLFKAADNAALRKQLGEKARQDVRNRPSIEEIRDQLKHILEMI